MARGKVGSAYPKGGTALVAILLAGVLLGDATPAAAGFANRKLVTVTGSQVVGGPHADFPIVFAVVDPELSLRDPVL